MVKPYSASHIGAVASSFTEMRLAGAVKERLVELMVDEIEKMVPEMELATLNANSQKKTLDDTKRTRLNYNRTRELMIERLNELESVGSQAVQAGIEHLETFLKRMLSSAEQAAAKDRVATIKPRHLSVAEKGLIVTSSDENSTEEGETKEVEEDVLEGQVSGSALTPMALRRLSRSFAQMPITDAAVEELLLWYYEVVDQTGHDIRNHAQLGANPAGFIDALDKMKDLMMLGWIRRMLVRAGKDASERGYKRIDVEQLIHLDAFE